MLPKEGGARPDPTKTDVPKASQTSWVEVARTGERIDVAIDDTAAIEFAK